MAKNILQNQNSKKMNFNNRQNLTGNKEKNNSTTFNPFTDKRVHNVTGTFFILLSLYLLLSFCSFFFTGFNDQSEIYNTGNMIHRNFENWGKAMGAYLSNWFIFNGFGIASFLLIPLFFITGFKIIFRKDILFPYSYSLKVLTFFLLWISITLGYIVRVFDINGFFQFLSGNLGLGAAETVNAYLGWGTPVLMFFLLLIFSIFYFNFKLENMFSFAETQPISNAQNTFSEQTVQSDQSFGNNVFFEIDKQNKGSDTQVIETKQEVPDKENDKVLSEDTLMTDKPVSPSIGGPTETVTKEITLEIEKPAEEKMVTSFQQSVSEAIRKPAIIPYDPSLELTRYKFPNLEILNEQPNEKSEVSDQELQNNKDKIINTLANYDISIDKIKATVGPTVTLYEIVPAAGVRISKIKNLEDDIALSLSALGIRIIAPMPGKGTIGIEVPNSKREIVSMKTVLSVEKFQKTEMDLPLALGKTISNEVFIADLAKMPHLLMAGATGQGKSAGLNAILTSLLYKKHPSQLKFVLIDPKKVELTIFKKIEKHFLAKLPQSEEAIITDVKQAVDTLNSLCLEMDLRYDLLKEAACRNIKEYNHKFLNRKLNPLEGHRFLPYTLLVIDELADLMLTSGKEVETPICRLAQLARAIGIHLVVATQRPSVNVITGLIKANFPVRLSYKVTSKVDSRTILDMGGADQLVGQGDMLLSINSNIFRLQGAFIDTAEVDSLCDYIGGQQAYPSAYNLPEPPTSDSSQNNTGDEDSLAEKDPMFEEAARILVMHQQGSTSLLQRRLKLGYNRAGRLIDQLEKAGIVGPFEGSKARDVLVHDEKALNDIFNTL